MTDTTWHEVVTAPLAAQGWIDCTQCGRALHDEGDVGRLEIHQRADEDGVRAYRLLCMTCAGTVGVAPGFR